MAHDPRRPILARPAPGSIRPYLPGWPPPRKARLPSPVSSERLAVLDPYPRGRLVS
jgi:hypothetical protein